MAYDLEEQEQLDELKVWWKQNGQWVLNAALVLIGLYLAYQGWGFYQNQQASKASAVYENLIKLDTKDVKNLKAIKSLSGQLIDQFSGTSYAGRAAVLAAKANYVNNDVKTAKVQLDWAASHAKEPSVAAIARLELANIQFQEKDYAASLKTLEEKHAKGFDGLYADLRGDILVAQGKNKEARAAYQEAIEKLDPQGHFVKYTQHKLEALGS
jgi:predicted negative regulator of RcsB-dependent stress response